MNEQLSKKNILSHLTQLEEAVVTNPIFITIGKVTKIVGMKIEAVGINVPVGTICHILVSEHDCVKAEVIGFSGQTVYLMATDEILGVKQGTRVLPVSNSHRVPVGMNLLGRIIDATGTPIDGGPPVETDETYPLQAKPMNPLQRKRISEPLDVGVRAINTLLTVGKGQRIGIFSGSGVGKSVLLGMMTRYTQADIVVVGLIGERGREVKEFIEENIGKEGLAKTVVVAVPADTSPLMRVNGAGVATALAEYYRDRGLDVLLIVDSLTRYAQAQREIALSVGELPATKGFSPSVFARLSQLVERPGLGSEQQGSITAFYNVLVEGDDMHDPIGDHVRSIVDGHIVLSRQLADRGHYPAIDIENSISRVMTAITDQKQQNYALLLKRLYSTYLSNENLINVGLYQAGSDRAIDESIKYKDVINQFLQQNLQDKASMSESMAQLYKLFT